MASKDVIPFEDIKKQIFINKEVYKNVLIRISSEAEIKPDEEEENTSAQENIQVDDTKKKVKIKSFQYEYKTYKLKKRL